MPRTRPSLNSLRPTTHPSPLPAGKLVSPSSTRICSIGRPSISAAICARMVYVPGADVGHRHFDGRDTIGTQPDIGFGELKRVAAGRRSHAHAYQPAAVANLARPSLLRLSHPNQARAFLQAGDQVTAGNREYASQDPRASLRIRSSIGSSSSFSASSSIAHSSAISPTASRAHALTRQPECPAAPGRCRVSPVWSGVERAGLQRRGLVVLLARQMPENTSWPMARIRPSRSVPRRGAGWCRSGGW